VSVIFGSSCAMHVLYHDVGAFVNGVYPFEVDDSPQVSMNRALNAYRSTRDHNSRCRAQSISAEMGRSIEWHCRFCCMTLRRLSPRRRPTVDHHIDFVSRVARSCASARSLRHPQCEVLSGH
jgi:hypothetical protein